MVVESGVSCWEWCLRDSKFNQKHKKIALFEGDPRILFPKGYSWVKENAKLLTSRTLTTTDQTHKAKSLT